MCKAGYSFQDEEGQVSCKIATCAAGKYATAGAYNYAAPSSTQIQTPNATNTTTTNVTRAGGGAINGTVSAINETAGGGVADVTKPADCSLCPGGKYSSKTGLGRAEECSFCPAGRWGDTEGADTLDECQLCKGGTFSDTSGATNKTCSGLCPPGTYSDDGYAQCAMCGVGKFQTKENSKKCVSCEAKKTTLGEGSTTCVCEKGRYMNDNGTCIACPDDVTCEEDGSTLEKVDLKPGAWRPSAKSDKIFECPVKDSCLGGNSTDKYVDGGVE